MPRGHLPYNYGMALSLRKATPSDYRETVAVLSEAMETLSKEAALSEADRDRFFASVPALLEDGLVYLAIENYRPVGVATVSYSVEDAFFPQSRSFRKSNDLLDAIDHSGEPLLVLTGIYVVGKRQNQKIGTDILHLLIGRYPNSTWILWNREANVKATRFFLRNSFLALNEKVDVECDSLPAVVLYRKYRPSGLCREAFW